MPLLFVGLSLLSCVQAPHGPEHNVTALPLASQLRDRVQDAIELREQLRGALLDDDAEVRRAAALGLARLAKDHRASSDLERALLAERDPETQAVLIGALATIGDADAAAALCRVFLEHQDVAEDTLIGALRGMNPQTAQAAAAALPSENDRAALLRQALTP